MTGAGIPFGRICNTKEACESEIIKRRHMLWQIDDPAFGETISVPGTPMKIHGCADQAERPAPQLGQHTDAILHDLLHLDMDAIKNLHETNVI